MTDERGGERDACVRWETLQHRGEGETHERRRIVGGEAMKLREHGRRGWRGVGLQRTLAQHRVERPRVAEETNGPRADVFVGVAQTAAEKRLIGCADTEERPERAEPEDRLRSREVTGE